MKKIKVSIIIVNFRVKEQLFACIKSIYDSKPKADFEIIVVDNDEVKTIEKELIAKFKDVKYIKSNSNLGYGGGNNLGAKNASGEYLFFLNPDTVVLNKAIDVLVNFLDKNNKAGIVAPLLLDKNNRPYEFQGNLELTPLRGIIVLSFLSKVFPKVFNKYWITKWNKNEIKDSYSIPGTAFVIKKDIFNKMGRFDEDFFLFFEEHDICKRVKDGGYGVFINPKAKIYHEWGASTKYTNEIKKIFERSRYLYFKKHFGLLKALLVETFLRINKAFLLILLTLLLALFLRIYNLSQSMVFIGDQGWFYLSAKDFLTEGKIPLVGITSSHTWLHQGPLWTYMLSVALLLGNFNPISGGMLTAMFGVGATFLMYKLGSSMFSEKVGLISAALYSASPLIIFFDRMPFDPSPIPFFTILYFYSIFKWIKGKNVYFPLIIIFLAILYNLELATFSLFFPLLFIFLYGLYKRKHWIKNTLSRKIFIYSITGLITVMAPIIVYDYANGFKQTAVFLGWVLIYKPFSFLFKHSLEGANSGIAVVVNFLLQGIRKIVFEPSLAIAFFLFSLSVVVVVKDLLKKNNFNLENPKLLLLIFLITSIGGILINKSPSDAYLPITFPLIILLITLFFDYLISKKEIRAVLIIFFFLIVVFNAYTSFKSSQTNGFTQKINAVDKIINLSNGREYNLVGMGPGSQFESFTMNYEYLLWWKGYPPSKKDENLKIIVSETQKGIIISKE